MELAYGLGGGNSTYTYITTYLLAQYDPFIEVTGAIAALSAMISPELKAANAGGRIPERVALNIGRRIIIPDVIIQDLSFDLDAPRNSAGLFLRNIVNLQLSGSLMFNGSEVLGIFQ